MKSDYCVKPCSQIAGSVLVPGLNNQYTTINRDISKKKMGLCSYSWISPGKALKTKPVLHSGTQLDPGYTTDIHSVCLVLVQLILMYAAAASVAGNTRVWRNSPVRDMLTIGRIKLYLRLFMHNCLFLHKPH